MVCTAALAGICACSAADGNDDERGGEDLCSPIIEVGFHFEGGEQDCLDWFANDGRGDCDDYDAFLDCACDCERSRLATKGSTERMKR